MDYIILKKNESCARKWCPNVCTFWLEITFAFGKMCHVSMAFYYN